MTKATVKARRRSTFSWVLLRGPMHSAKYNNRITIREGDCYIGQPYSGYAAKVESDKECIIVGVLIRKDIFIREFLSSLSADTAMLRFFLAPHKVRF